MSKPLSPIWLLMMAALVCAPLSLAFAHGAMQRQQNACMLKIGPDFMYFSGYQPAASRNRFCEDIPTIGATIFVLDYAQDEMREMSTDFRIIRDIGDKEPQERLDAVTVAYLPPKVYPAGTLNFEHVFNETGPIRGDRHGRRSKRRALGVAVPLHRRRPAAVRADALLSFCGRRRSRSRAFRLGKG